MQETDLALCSLLFYTTNWNFRQAIRYCYDDPFLEKLDE